MEYFLIIYCLEKSVNSNILYFGNICTLQPSLITAPYKYIGDGNHDKYCKFDQYCKFDKYCNHDKNTVSVNIVSS